ncbi:MAG: methyltransferase [Thalassolituus sp.]|jgi:chemotaxis protein methyltransferase CheR/type IV pilus assembly protein PilK|uniref:protein-glutamate O-methyltransferase n=1 Tax=Thalassolituus maritimus TaxID=484498 RepID=A0ABQ0A2X2_9GAMM|nr:CheR family methyltransferase [Pseudomonadota bacterium]MEC8103408.1 CheR family methyltransferase [Pseudomonadota bacterium]MEC8522787.1 CheR family methyltransferase [Pseudomonadota bacterium]MEE2749442.1 CheR family methyltransferase [Pseudomonadota bacterium]TNC86856.1 MAG: methyltransferase [Thalassolituus sp.]|tara:strand:+ start:52 stop:939 length:888 start_codon:yes stop_codon:yes gene_type:complete
MSQSIRQGLSTVPELDDVQFSRWQGLLEERTGMYLPQERRSFLQTSLGLRMLELDIRDYAEYYDKVQDGPSGMMEWSTLVDRLTVQETRFFRDDDALQLVVEHMRKLRPRLQVNDETMEFWSVGCSSGEEAYTLAMLAEENLGSADIKYSVTGTDISTIVLRKARSGRYPLRALERIPVSYHNWAIEPLSSQQVEIATDLRRRCCFSQVNILNLKHCPLNSQHVIFCQNVLIYFRRWRRREILDALAQRLAPGGLLVIGLGEMVDWQHPLLESLHSGQVTAFVRKSTSTGESARR